MCEPGHSDGTATLATGGGMATAVIVAICFLILDTSAAVATGIAGLVATGLLLAAAAAAAAVAGLGGAVAIAWWLGRRLPLVRVARRLPPVRCTCTVYPVRVLPAGRLALDRTQPLALPPAPALPAPARQRASVPACAHMIIRVGAPAPGRPATPVRGWGLSDAGSPRSGRCQEP